MSRSDLFPLITEEAKRNSEKVDSGFDVRNVIILTALIKKTSPCLKLSHAN